MRLQCTHDFDVRGEHEWSVAPLPARAHTAHMSRTREHTERACTGRLATWRGRRLRVGVRCGAVMAAWGRRTTVRARREASAPGAATSASTTAMCPPCAAKCSATAPRACGGRPGQRMLGTWLTVARYSSGRGNMHRRRGTHVGGGLVRVGGEQPAHAADVAVLRRLPQPGRVGLHRRRRVHGDPPPHTHTHTQPPPTQPTPPTAGAAPPAPLASRPRTIGLADPDFGYLTQPCHRT